jgi:MHS family proline/betaine transporter-like MFS transporter
MILILRLLQGLAVGGEYGGAVVYVAEYSHIRQRGFTTSWIQATASLGFFLSLLVILTIKRSMTDLQFNDWGWRLPFLLSILLVGISFFIRLKMEESPLFRRLSVKEDTSQNPLEETLRDPTNFRLILMSLFAVVMGSGVVVYTIIYAYQFLLRACRVDSTQTDNWICIAFLLGSIFFIFFGWLSDKIGRKPVLLTGMGLAILFTKPIFKEFYKMANPQKSELLGEKPNLSISLLKKQVKKDTLGVQLPAYPIYVIDTINKTSLVFYTVDTVKVFSKTALYKDSTIVTSFKKETCFADSTTRPKNYKPVLNKTVLLGRSSLFYLFGYLSILGVFGAMVSGPLGAFLVDLYPTKIRCTSLSFPYHVGNGVFGGLIPLFATILYEYSKTKENPLGDPFAGLDYPMMVAFISLLIGTFFMPRNSKERENIGGNREYQF